MSLGSRLDDLIGDALVAAGRLADKAVTALGPRSFDNRAFMADRVALWNRSAEQLAEAEADEDVYEPLGEYPDIPSSAPSTAASLAAERPGSVTPPDTDPGHPTQQQDIDALCQILASHHPYPVPGGVDCGCQELLEPPLADQNTWRRHIAAILYDALTPRK